MTTTLKWRVEERFHDVDGLVVADEATGQSQHVGIVVLAGKAGDLGYPAQCRTYALVLVESHVYPLATTANTYSRIAFALFHGSGAQVCKVGVVATFIAECAEVGVCDSVAFQIIDDCQLGGISCMVAAQAHRNVFFDD